MNGGVTLDIKMRRRVVVARHFAATGQSEGRAGWSPRLFGGAGAIHCDDATIPGMLGRLSKWLFGGKARRRAAILDGPFPADWLAPLRLGMPFADRLSDEEQSRLHDFVRIFIAEKQFVGCGLDVTDEMKVTIAAGACVLLLGIEHLDVFPRLREVIVHPHDWSDSVEAIGPDGRRYEIRSSRAGEAWRRGPVVLAWNSVERSVASPCDGYNVVTHEFAHVLDMQSGAADGIPPLATRAENKEWTQVFFREFQAFVQADRRGGMTFIDPYGATHPAEFFAVASEHFFEQAPQLAMHHPELFALLESFYRQNPTQWKTVSARSRWRSRRDSGNW